MVAKDWDPSARVGALPSMMRASSARTEPARSQAASTRVCVHSRLHRAAVRPRGRGRLHPRLPVSAVRPAGVRHRPLQFRREAGLRVILVISPAPARQGWEKDSRWRLARSLHQNLSMKTSPLSGGLTPHRLRVTFIHGPPWHGGVGGRSSDGGSDGDEEHLELELHIWSRS